MENRTQKFLPGTEKTEEITAVAVSPNKKFAAVAEKSDKGAITVFDLHSLKRRRLLTATDSQSKEFVSMAFSPDSKQLMAQGGAPDWALTIWTWEKAKFVATTRTGPNPNSVVCQCSFSPKDNNLICVTGNSIFKQFKLVDSTLKSLPNPLSKREPQNYLCHAWLGEERVVLGTDTGDLLVIDGSELKAFLPRAPTDSNSIESVVGFSKAPAPLLPLLPPTSPLLFLYARGAVCAPLSEPPPRRLGGVSARACPLRCRLDTKCLLRHTPPPLSNSPHPALPPSSPPPAAVDPQPTRDPQARAV